MRKCQICGSDYYLGDDLDPAEHCLCGNDSGWQSPWEIDEWRGIFLWLKWRFIWLGWNIYAQIDSLADLLKSKRM